MNDLILMLMPVVMFGLVGFVVAAFIWNDND